MRQHVDAAKQENAPVLDEAFALFKQKNELETKNRLLDAFNKHFILSEKEITILTDTSESVNVEFFAVLIRAKQIHTDCQILLGNENQRLGLELMEQTSKVLNGAYQKLYRWIQHELKALDLENPQISSIIRQALRALAERATLFQSCLDYFAKAREHILTDLFYSALTGSSMGHEQNTMTKPIEFNAHDPLRYVGDMLAWAHSTMVSEREALESLFISDGDVIAKGVQSGRENEPWSEVGSEAFDGQKALEELVSQNLDGVSKAIRQRVDQVIRSHEDPVLLYKIANLVNFYGATFTKLLGTRSSILETLSALEGSALGQFSTATKDHVTSIQADLGGPPADLRIPDFFDEALVRLKALLKTYESSLEAVSSQEIGLQPILTTSLTPYLECCQQLAQLIDSPASDIFFTNCLLAAKTSLSAFGFFTSTATPLDTALDDRISNLTSHQHAFFLHTSGLHPLVAALAPFSSTNTPASLLVIPSLPIFRPDTLAAASQTLDDFLPSALMDATENLKQLSSAKLAAEITSAAAERFCEDFEFVEGKLAAVDELRNIEEHAEEDEDKNGVDGEGGPPEAVPLRTLFPRTSGEIRVLLS